MFRLLSDAELMKAFRPKDQPRVELPVGMSYPVVIRDYFAWTHPSGGRVFLVFATRGGAPTGIVFDSNGGGTDLVPNMCDWCHSYSVGSKVAVLTARLNSRKRVGVNICGDLSCRQKLEDEANRTGRSVLPALDGLVERMGRFASEALRIDLSGAGR